MNQLEELSVFVRVAEAGGIGKAADQLGIAKSAVSRRLAELEKRLGVQLLSRTTRKSSLTEEGQRCYEHALRVLDVVGEFNAAVAQEDQEISGRIRISTPSSFAINHLLPVIDQFLRQYPSIRLDMDMSDGFVDLIESGFDLAIRIGDLRDSSYQARQLAPIKTCLAASPAYLDEHGRPESIEELNQHSFLHYGNVGTSTIKLEDKQGKLHSLNVTSKVSVNNGDFLNDLAIAGHGIVFTPTFISWQALQKGELERVLPEFETTPRFAYALYPKTRFLPKRVRLFIDFLAEYVGDQPYWDAQFAKVRGKR